jgi:hypothetical protein
MSAFYEELQADAHELLAELGQLVTYTRYSVETDLVEGTSGRTPQFTQSLPTAVLPVKDTASGFDNLDLRPVDGTNATTEVKFAIISAVGASFVPVRGDEATFGGKTWVVLSTTTLNLDGATDVVYLAGLQA